MDASRRLTIIGGALLLGVALFGVAPAHAAPTVDITRIHETADCSGVCSNTDPRVPDASDGAADGQLQIHWSASTTTPLDVFRWFRIEVLPPGGDASDDDDWVCVASTSNRNARHLNWDSGEFAGSSLCPAHSEHGSGTPNGTFRIRVRASDGTQSVSAAERVSIGNIPPPPSWSADPRVTDDRTTDRRVVLEWSVPADGYAHEFRIGRAGPGGSREFAVSASKPGGQGCTVNGSVYTCQDDDFPSSGYAGDYSYTIFVLRSTAPRAGAQPCAFGGGSCIASPGSGARTASIGEPAPRPVPTQNRPTPTPTPTTQTPTVRPTASSAPAPVRVCGEFCEGTYEDELPFDQRGGFPSGGGSSIFGGTVGEGQQIASDIPFAPGARDPRPFRALAGGLLMVLVAAHLARMLRANPR